MKYELPKLPYAYDALEPFIDARTMELHHTKHHQTYVNKLNEALDKHPEIADMPLEELLRGVQAGTVPPDIRTAVRNHGGGHANHSFFWTVMGPTSLNDAIKANPDSVKNISSAIVEVFGSNEKFKEEFTKAAVGVFGSGWAWLVANDHPQGAAGAGAADEKKLMIITTPNQDSPLMQGLKPLLGLDVWEHAYYLKHTSDRAGYIQDWWNVVNWAQVDKNLNS